MNYTQNLNLPQWEETDRIHHDDFNDAMAKLDAALKAANDAIANCAAFTKLKDITTEAAQRPYSFDVSDIDWSRWHYVHIDIMPKTDSRIELYPNNDTNLSHNALCSDMSTNGGTYFAFAQAIDSESFATRITLHIGRQSNRVVTATYSYPDSASQLYIGRGIANLSFLSLTSLQINLTSGYPLPVGSRIILWGEG